MVASDHALARCLRWPSSAGAARQWSYTQHRWTYLQSQARSISWLGRINRQRRHTDKQQSDAHNASIECAGGAIEVARSYGLPLPPVLDPHMVAARHRYRQPKPSSSTTSHDDFKEAFALNPYARALAEPERSCAVTGVSLPRHFLQPFVTVFKAASSGASDGSADTTRTMPHLTPYSTTMSKTVVRKSYTALNSHLLQQINRYKAGSRGKNPWHKLVPDAAMTKYGLSNRQNWVWDLETPQIVESELKNEVIRRLMVVFQARQPRMLGVVDLGHDAVAKGAASATSYSDHQTNMNVQIADARPAQDEMAFDAKNTACVLCLRTSAQTSQAQVSPQSKVDAWVGKDNFIECFDIAALFGQNGSGESVLDELTDGTRFAGAEFVALRKSPRTLSIVLALMRLSLYVSARELQNQQ